MRYSSYDRFQGLWWGSIIAQAIAFPQSVKQSWISDSVTADWRSARRQVAEIILGANQLESDYICQQLLAKERQVDLLKYNSSLLSLLPLIIFCGDDYNLLGKIIEQYCLRSTGSVENITLRQDILLWSYLLTSVFQSKLESQSSPIYLLEKISQKISLIAAQENLSTEKLMLVEQGVKNGISLCQLVEQLASESTVNTAIALSWYCFITSPDDFKLSVQKAASVKSDLAYFSLALTGTLSGAYNGVVGIPWSWRIKVEPSLNQLERVSVTLFKSWLGVYSATNERALYNPEFDAVATPSIIQPRKNLAIISQKPFFS